MRPHRQLPTLLMLVAVLIIGVGTAQADENLDTFWVGTAQSDESLDAWRREADRVRHLILNDVPQARLEVLRLQARLPEDAAPADRVRILNRLARIETYLAETEVAARHLEEAHELARRHGDRLGQVEANLTIMLNAVSEGRVDKMRQASAETLPLLDGIDRPELLAEAMQRTTMLYFRHNQLAAALTIALQNEDIARRSGDPLAQAYAHHGLAIAYDQSGAYEKALEHFRQTREFARAAGSRNHEAFALNGLAQTTANLGDPQEAEKLSRQAIELIRATGMPFALLHFRYGLATILRMQGRLGDAVATLDEVVAGYRRHPSKIGLWWSLNTRAGDLLALGKLDAAERDAAEALALGRAVDFPLYIAESGKRLAAIAAARGDYKRAHTLRAEADAAAKRAEQLKASEIILATAERFQAEARQREIEALKRKEAASANERRLLLAGLFASILMLSITTYFIRRLHRSRQSISRLNDELSAANADLRESEVKFRSLTENVPDSLVRYDREGRRIYVNPAFEALTGIHHDVVLGRAVGAEWSADPTAEDYIALLRQTLETGAPADFPLTWYKPEAAPITCAVRIVAERDETGRVVGALAIGRDISRKVEMERQLQESRDLLRQFAARLETVREEERKRIAREVHDELGQVLTAMRLELATLKLRCGDADPVLAERCQHLTNLTDRTIHSVRGIATSLRPAALDMGVVSALEWLAAEFQTRAGVVCRLRLNANDLQFDEEQSVALFRIVQESLTNVARYAEARQVEVELDSDADACRLSIRDDGKGFDPQTPKARSFGLVGINERALMLGGAARIDSAPGRGTLVEIRIPSQRPERTEP